MGRLVEMVVESVRVHMLTNRHVVILKDTQRERYLPIWIGAWEASAIAMRLQGMAAERPLTHDLLVATMHAIGGRMERVVVTELAAETYHAKLVVATRDGDSIEVDARPSDALAIAVRTDCPIYADEDVLTVAALASDPDVDADEAGETDEPDAEPRAPRPPIESVGGGDVVDPRLDLFRDFVNSLDQDPGEGGRRS